MPVTRSTSRQTSQQPSGQPYASRRTNSSGSSSTKNISRPPSNEIIVLSSDDDEPPPKGTLKAKKSPARAPKKKVAPLALSGDVLEISSDEESRPKRASTRGNSSETKDKTIKKLQEELNRSEQRLTSTSRELEELKRGSNKDVLSGLEEHTLCEVCTLTMWCPYTLPECGHSFCESCLTDWFSTTQAQHMTTNPQLDDNRAALAEQIRAFIQMVPNLHAYGLHGQQHARAVLNEVRRHRPEFTCPSCRKQVLNKPVEDFRLKNLIGQIAGLLGETSSDKHSPVHQGSGPFDHFFAAPIVAR